MKRFLPFMLILIFSGAVDAQQGFLFIKKGYKKKRTYTEGDRILLRLRGDTILGGLITLLKDDTIYLLGKPIPVSRVEGVIVRKKKEKAFHIPINQLLLITGGVALTTTGLTLSNQADFKEALTAGMAIGYGPLAVQYIISKIKLGRREFRIGRKYRLQLIDFHLPRQRGF